MKWYEDPVYIKMCDCEEIQKGWKPDIGDYYLKKATDVGEKDEVVIIADLRTNHFGRLIRLPNIWLRRQDQLQEMCNPREYPVWLAMDFNEFIVKKAFKVGDTRTPRTMEQLWLAFVMKEKHSKTWDGSKWIKEALCVSSCSWVISSNV